MKIFSNRIFLGYSSGVGFCLAVAYSTIVIHRVNQFIDPWLSVLVTFLVCTLWFIGVNFLSDAPPLLRKLSNHKKTIFWINVLSFINWISTFASLKFINPVLYISLFTGVVPFTTLIVCFFSKTKKISVMVLIFPITAIITLSLITLIFWGNSTDQYQFIAGVFFSIFSGVSSSLYIVLSRVFGQSAKVSVSQILAIRFILLIIISGVVCLSNQSFNKLHIESFATLIKLAFVSTIIPLYCIQKSISTIGAYKSSVILTLTPIFTYIFLFIQQGSVNIPLFFLLILLTTMLVWNIKSDK